MSLQGSDDWWQILQSTIKYLLFVSCQLSNRPRPIAHYFKTVWSYGTTSKGHQITVKRFKTDKWFFFPTVFRTRARWEEGMRWAGQKGNRNKKKRRVLRNSWCSWAVKSLLNQLLSKNNSTALWVSSKLTWLTMREQNAIILQKTEIKKKTTTPPSLSRIHLTC